MTQLNKFFSFSIYILNHATIKNYKGQYKTLQLMINWLQYRSQLIFNLELSSTSSLHLIYMASKDLN